MFEVGDIIKSRYGRSDSTYRHGIGIYKVIEVINNDHMHLMLLLDSGSKFDFDSNPVDWILDPIYCRKYKIIKILEKIENKL